MRSGIDGVIDYHATLVDSYNTVEAFEFSDRYLFNTALDEQTASATRYYNWKACIANMKARASRRLEQRLAQFTDITRRKFATATYNQHIYAAREDLRHQIYAAVKKHGDPRRLPNDGTSHNALFAFMLEIEGETARLTLERMHPQMYVVRVAAQRHLYKLQDGVWKPTVWAVANASWWINSPYSKSHFVHVSEKDPALLAYTQNGDKLVRDIQTQIKPGKYLQQFFGDVLSETDIRDWAQRQVAANQPAKLHIVPNTDPDGWVWVYEHPSGFSSCMQYNHPNRYLDNRLHGEHHPVRTYAHPKNNLALAYIGDPVHSEDGRVFARAIVNQKTMTYVRIFGDDRIQHALADAGYKYDGHHTLEGEILHLRELDDGYIVPYLDGNATNVDVSYHEGEDVLRISAGGDYDAQQSSGLVEVESKRATCCECGERCDEDGMTYVEAADGEVCESCLDDRFVYAYLRHGQDWCYVNDCVRCRSDGEWYHTDYASYHDVCECASSGDFYHIDDLVCCEHGRYADEYIHIDLAKELPDGTWCYAGDYDDVMAEHFAEEDEETIDETQPLYVTTLLPEPANLGA